MKIIQPILGDQRAPGIALASPEGRAPPVPRRGVDVGSVAALIGRVRRWRFTALGEVGAAGGEGPRRAREPGRRRLLSLAGSEAKGTGMLSPLILALLLEDFHFK